MGLPRSLPSYPSWEDNYWFAPTETLRCCTRLRRKQRRSPQSTLCHLSSQRHLCWRGQGSFTCKPLHGLKRTMEFSFKWCKRLRVQAFVVRLPKWHSWKVWEWRSEPLAWRNEGIAEAKNLLQGVGEIKMKRQQQLEQGNRTSKRQKCSDYFHVGDQVMYMHKKKSTSAWLYLRIVREDVT